MRLYSLQIAVGLAYGLAFLFELPLLVSLFDLTPMRTHGDVLFVLWPAPLAAALWAGMVAEKRARLRRAEAGPEGPGGHVKAKSSSTALTSGAALPCSRGRQDARRR